MIVVNAASPYGKLSDFLGAARAKPGELTFAALDQGPSRTSASRCSSATAN